ncbi:unnamed protein product [Lymnaea stagnalis]|uniref:Uncharacterized protein n=1 Tax=Lymnaea stagnalis TaxID=6523 RepID=A0AAV2H5E4_LYMST
MRENRLGSVSWEALIMKVAATVFNGAVSQALAFSLLLLEHSSASTTEAQPTGDDAGGDFLDDDNNKAMFLVLPLFICVYGSCCVIYCVHKCRRYYARKKKSREILKRRREEAIERECYFNKVAPLHDIDRARLFENRLPDNLSTSCNSSESSIFILDHGESDTYCCPHSLWGTTSDSQIDVLDCTQKNSVPPGNRKKTFYSNPSFEKNIDVINDPLSELFRESYYSKVATKHFKKRTGKIENEMPDHPGQTHNTHDSAILSLELNKRDHNTTDRYGCPQSLLATPRDTPENAPDRTHPRPFIPGYRKKNFFSPRFGYARAPLGEKLRSLHKDQKNSIANAVTTLLKTHRAKNKGGDNSEQETSIKNTSPCVAAPPRKQRPGKGPARRPRNSSVPSEYVTEIKSIAAVRRKISKEQPKVVTRY